MTPSIVAYTRHAHSARALELRLDACDPERTSNVRIVTDASLLLGDELAPRCLLHDVGLSLDERIAWARARAGRALCLHIVSDERRPIGCDDPESAIVALPASLLVGSSQSLRERLAMLHGMSVQHVLAPVERPDEQARLIGAAERCALVSGPASLLAHLIARERIAGRMRFAPSPHGRERSVRSVPAPARSLIH